MKYMIIPVVNNRGAFPATLATTFMITRDSFLYKRRGIWSVTPQKYTHIHKKGNAKDKGDKRGQKKEKF